MASIERVKNRMSYLLGSCELPARLVAREIKVIYNASTVTDDVKRAAKYVFGVVQMMYNTEESISAAMDLYWEAEGWDYPDRRRVIA